jgi:hypothetical protein
LAFVVATVADNLDRGGPVLDLVWRIGHIVQIFDDHHIAQNIVHVNDWHLMQPALRRDGPTAYASTGIDQQSARLRPPKSNVRYWPVASSM